MSIFQAGPSIFAYHILPALLASLIYYLIAKIFIFIFRINKPSFRYIIYLLVMYKSILLLLGGANYSTTIVPRKSFGFGFRFYDFLGLMPFKASTPLPDNVVLSIAQSPWFYIIVSLTIVIVLLLLLLRWFATAWFLNKLASDSNSLNININKYLDDAAAKMKIKSPTVLVSLSDVAPLTIGIIKPKIILPSWIEKSCSKREIEVIIGHELAHIKRKDNLFQWVTLFLKDLLFFSPFSLLAYNYTQLYKEQAADNLFLRIAPEKASLLVKTIAKVSKKLRTQQKSSASLTAKANFADTALTKNRLKVLNSKNKKPGTALNTAISALGLFVFFWFKAWIVIKIGQKGLMILS